jgi:hypothetical protein
MFCSLKENSHFNGLKQQPSGPPVFKQREQSQNLRGAKLTARTVVSTKNIIAANPRQWQFQKKFFQMEQFNAGFGIYN